MTPPKIKFTLSAEYDHEKDEWEVIVIGTNSVADHKAVYNGPKVFPLMRKAERFISRQFGEKP